MQLFIDTLHTNVSVKNASFFIQNKSTNRLISPRRISSIAVSSNASFNAAAIKLAANNDIPIFYYDYTGKLIAQLRSPFFLKHSELRILQLEFMRSDKGKQWAVDQLLLKTDLQIQTIQRLVRENKTLKLQGENIIIKLKEKRERLKTEAFHTNHFSNSLMGMEGGIARLYFSGLNLFLNPIYQFQKRTRQPGEDYFNTALNYLYGMTYSHITKAIHAAGLDTFVGALHKTNFKESLVYDCIEPFRPLIDRLLLDLCSANTLNDLHFKKVPKGYWLSKEGKKALVPKFTDYLESQIILEGKRTSIANHMYVQSKKLKFKILEDVSDLL